MTTGKDFLDGLLDRQEHDQPIRCSIGKFLTSELVEQSIRDGVREALDVPRIFNTTLADVISDTGFPVSEKSVRTHRKARCSCAKRGI